MGIHVRQVYSGESVAPRVAGCVTIYALTKGAFGGNIDVENYKTYPRHHPT